ncbi:hypothetical protein ACOSQ2_002166 [Xanthoceras sorbifolium]
MHDGTVRTTQEKEEDDGTSKGNSETTIVQEENSEKEDSDSSEAASAHEAQVPDESEAMIFGGRLERGKNRSSVSLWMTVMHEESSYKNTTWKLVPLPHGRKAIGKKWIYKITRDSNDQVERFRARLVVKGYAQKECIDFSEILSPMV